MRFLLMSLSQLSDSLVSKALSSSFHDGWIPLSVGKERSRAGLLEAY